MDQSSSETDGKSNVEIWGLDSKVHDAVDEEFLKLHKTIVGDESGTVIAQNVRRVLDKFTVQSNRIELGKSLLSQGWEDQWHEQHQVYVTLDLPFDLDGRELANRLKDTVAAFVRLAVDSNDPDHIEDHLLSARKALKCYLRARGLLAKEAKLVASKTKGGRPVKRTAEDVAWCDDYKAKINGTDKDAVEAYNKENGLTLRSEKRLTVIALRNARHNRKSDRNPKTAGR